MQKHTKYDERVLSLLRYALEKKGISDRAYFIGKEDDERSQSDKLCLLKGQAEQWTALYSERGTLSQKVLHSNIRDAVIYMFWKLNQKDTPWDYTTEWAEKLVSHFNRMTRLHGHMP